MRTERAHPSIAAARLSTLVAIVALAAGAAPLASAAPSKARPQQASASTAGAALGDPIAGAFVYPVGDELDYTKARAGEGAGFYVSDPYLARRGKRKMRVHYGVDLANGRGGAEVHAIAAGVVVVSERNALTKVRKKQRLKLPVVVNGKRSYHWSTRYRTVYVWRTGWGNRVVIRHTLPSGEIVHSLYAHLKPRSVLVQRGDVVAAGQPIARVGRTGHATSAHLHIEIRKSFTEADAQEEDAIENAAETAEDETGDAEHGGVLNGAMRSAQARSVDARQPEVALRTIDPMAFLERHVARFTDLAPGSWQARYALAACRDGILGGDGAHFDPDDAVTRGDFYRALVLAFHLGTPFTKPGFQSTLDALIDSGIVDASSSRREHAGDSMSRSDALELVLRCLDQRSARGRSLGLIEPEQVCHDFNLVFAGAQAAAEADRDARQIAATETAARQKAARERYALALKAARAKGARSRARMLAVKPVAPVPTLAPGFASLAESATKLSRVETCLLLASALRLQPSQLSALERAASRVANSG